MRIVPVIDLKAGMVVRGVAGRRELYRPVESVLDCDATPKRVATAFVSEFGFRSVYVADLDAIGGAEPNWEAYDAIASSGLRLIVDAGINCVQRAAQFVDRSPDDGVVIGLESLRCERDLADLGRAIGTERAVFSLDLRNGKPLTKISAWRTSRPMELVDAAVIAGFRRLIVLDLASVGVGEGVSVKTLCTSIQTLNPQLEIAAGGGVRNRLDLMELASSGCNAALVASALHDGRLSQEDLSGFS